MNKKALLGYLFLGVIVILLIIGMIFYFQFRKSGLQISTGSVVIDVKYNEAQESDNSSEMLNKTNETELNLSAPKIIGEE